MENHKNNLISSMINDANNSNNTIISNNVNINSNAKINNNWLYKLLTNEKEISWQQILYDLVKNEELNPWDIDVSFVAQKYLEVVKTMQELNFFVSGKVILAAAFLVRLKTYRFVDDDIAGFDSILFPAQEEELPELLEEARKISYEKRPLAIKSPLARKRKVTIEDLVKALELALRVDARKRERIERWMKHDLKMPERKVNIGEWITSIFEKIKNFFIKKEVVTFTKLVGKESGKNEKILTLYSLLHLDSEKKISISQKEHFGEIYIHMPQ